MTIPVQQVTWLPCWRIVSSRFPPIQLFERVTDPADLEAVLALESLTNDRLRAEVGQLDLVPQEDRRDGERERDHDRHRRPLDLHRLRSLVLHQVDCAAAMPCVTPKRVR